MLNSIIQGDALTRLRELESESIDCCITSPPYWALRDYKSPPQIWDAVNGCAHEWQQIETVNQNATGSQALPNSKSLNKKEAFDIDYNKRTTYSDFCSKCNAWKGSLGLEPTFDLYIKHLIQIFNEVKRILKKSGSCWVNIGDTYNSSKQNNTHGRGIGALGQKESRIETDQRLPIDRPIKGIGEKSLCLIPQRFAIAMVDAGWICRNTIIWYKPNCMPSSAKDRFTVDFEYLFFFVKNQKYYFDTQYEPQQTDWSFDTDIRGADTKNWLDTIEDGRQPHSKLHAPRWPKIGGNKAPGYNNPTYSGNQPEIKELPIDERSKREAMRKGWEPDKQTYTDWYFNTRPKVSWHNHENDAEMGLGMQCRGEPPRVMMHPFGRIKRCVWQIPTQPFSDCHFAVFPEKLIETPIKASCPEYVCKKCGKPREKIIEKEYETAADDSSWPKSQTLDPAYTRYGKRRLGKAIITAANTTGWIECNCNAGWDGGIVLDPFIGSGTVGVVAMQNARNFIGIELNQSYIDMAMERLDPYLKQERITAFVQD